jgi:tetratricopeptide (TPR) repeat protein
VQALLEQARAAYAKLEYERALDLTHRASEFSRNADDDVKISLVEGVMLYSLGRDDEAEAAFRKAVALDREAKLPFLVSPKIEHKLETVRTEVKKVIPRDPERLLPEHSEQTATNQIQQTAEAPEPPPRNLRPAAWAVGGGGVALLLGGGGSLLVAKSRHDALTSGSQNTAPATAIQYRNEGPVWQTAGWALVSAGVAAVGTSAILFAVDANANAEPAAGLMPGGAWFGVAGALP